MAATAKRATDPADRPTSSKPAPMLRKSNKIEPMLIDSLRESPWQPRVSISPNDLEDLKKSIRDFGFVGYIPVRRSSPADPTSPLEIVFGHRRVMAARLLGMETVPAMICQLDDAAMMRLAFVENSTQKKMTYWEEARHLKEMQDRLGLTIRKLADMLGLSRNYVHSRLQLLNLPEGSPLRIAAERNDIVMANALAFTNLSRSLDPEHLDQLLEDVRKGELNVLDLQGLERALAKASELSIVDLDEQGNVVHTATIEDQTQIKAELVDAARRKELHAYQPVRATPGVTTSRIVREAAALERRKQAQDENAAAAATVTETASNRPQGPAADAIGADLTGDPAATRADARQETAQESPLERTIRTSHSSFSRKDGLAFAMETVEQLRGIMVHLRPRVEKADFAQLDPATREELRAMRDEFAAMLASV
ncbi:MAG: ParB/RepB/Spo0J family partition protein [Thermomicrobiales bacterium]